VEYVDGAGGKRVQAFLLGPEGRRVRLGLFLSQPDDAVWITGALPSEGQASPPLPETVRFRAGADGALLNDVPLGGEPLEWKSVSQDKLQQWVAAVQPFHNGGADLTAGMHASADLDRDGELETLLCISGRIRMLDPRCVLVDEVGSETRMYAVGLPWTADGGAPVGFTVDGAPYVFMGSPMDPSIGFVLRYYSAGWIAETVE